MPAAAVIPAPVAYIKTAAVEKLVVGSWAQAGRSAARRALPSWPSSRLSPGALNWVPGVAGTFTLKKLECSKQASRLNSRAWNNGIGPRFYCVGFRNSR